MSDIVTVVNRIRRRQSVAKRQGEREATRRAGVKAIAYLRGRTLAKELGLASNAVSGKCTCKYVGPVRDGETVTYPHMHVFGTVLPMRSHDSIQSAAKAFAASHTFAMYGNRNTWKAGKVSDSKTRNNQKVRAFDGRHTSDLDKAAKAREALKSGNRRDQIRACEVLELDISVLPTVPIWRNALHNRKVAKAAKRRTGAIQVYRG